MNLELESVDIKDVRFANKTTIKDGILFINKGELLGGPGRRLLFFFLATSCGKKETDEYQETEKIFFHFTPRF